MAVVNAREWMEEPLLKAYIDPIPAPEESKGLNVAQGFLGRHKGADVQVPLNKGIVLSVEKQCYCGRNCDMGSIRLFSLCVSTTRALMPFLIHIIVLTVVGQHHSQITFKLHMKLQNTDKVSVFGLNEVN